MNYFVNTFVSLLVATSCCFAKVTLEYGEEIHTLNANYFVHKKLGEGAFGEVYKVENTNNEVFALKSYKNNVEGNTVIVDMYSDGKREFDLGKKFDHPGIIKSYDYFTYHFPLLGYRENVLLEFVNGQNLAETYKKSFQRNQTILQMIQVCEALKYAHSQGYLFLDAHSGNIMVDNSSEIKLIDLASFISFDEMLKIFLPLFEPESTKRTSEVPEKIKNAVLNHPACLKLIEIEKSKHSTELTTNVLPKEAFYHFLNSFSFELMTETCVAVLKKADLTRNEMIQLRFEVKKLAWIYSEDVEENCELTFDHYVDELVKNLINLL